MEVTDKGTFYQLLFSRMHLLEIWLTTSGSETERTGHMLKKILQLVPDSENVDIENLHSRTLYISKKLMKYWKIVNRCKENLLQKHAEWLAMIETIDLPRSAVLTTFTSIDNVPRPGVPNIGRPRKDFSECSKRSQRRRLAELSKHDESTVSTLMDISSQSESNTTEISANETLSLIAEAKLTKHQYLLIKQFVNSRKCPVLPPYEKILEAKKQCYPKKVEVFETVAEVELQSLLDHTATRILDSQTEVLNSIDYETMGDVVLIGKWGFDGSTGHSEYKQCFSTGKDTKDESLFVTSYVPLRLVSLVATTGEETILWKNPRPSSTRFCRPLRFQFAKETKELTSQEEKYFKDKICKLLPTKYRLNDNELNVHHELQLTMVDGKICSALSDSSSMRCYICNATPKEMNFIDTCLQKEIDTSKLQFGLSTLHAWIRFFEYLIHVSYRLDDDVMKWQVRSSKDKEQMAKRKKTIQDKFKQKLGLIVDKPRSGGSGTSNDGNTARRFFKNSAISAEITGIKKEVIDRCSTILHCLSSGYKINPDKFKVFALDTARLLVQEFEWYPLPASVHKVLIHGSQVIEQMIVPIGELSEEAAESTNKVIKSFRLNNTRKFSRVATNTDLLNRLLLNSDSLITGLRKLPKKKKTVLNKTVLSLLDI